jgi:hypothetical protein
MGCGAAVPSKRVVQQQRPLMRAATLPSGDAWGDRIHEPPY